MLIIGAHEGGMIAIVGKFDPRIFDIGKEPRELKYQILLKFLKYKKPTKVFAVQYYLKSSFNII